MLLQSLKNNFYKYDEKHAQASEDVIFHAKLKGLQWFQLVSWLLDLSFFMMSNQLSIFSCKFDVLFKPGLSINRIPFFIITNF